MARRARKILAVCAAAAAVGIGWLVVGKETPAAPVAATGANGSSGGITRLPLALLREAAPPVSVPYLADNPELATDQHFDLGAGRVAATDSAGSHLIAVPRLSGAEICLIATEPAAPRSGGGGCAKREEFLRKGLVSVRIRDAVAEVIGLFPDDVTTVIGRDSNGVDRTFPVRRNTIRVPLEQARVVVFAVNGKAVTEDLRGLRTDF